jgi:hypothetical protein
MSDSTWDFPPGAVGAHASVKGYAAEAKDGHAGEVSWAVYAPGESYLVVTRHPHLHGKHHVVPAGAVSSVDHEERVVKLELTQAEVDRLPAHEQPSQQVDWDYVNRFEIGWLRGGGGHAPDPDS